MKKTAAALSLAMTLTLLTAAPASAGKWDPYEGHRARDLRWLGAVYTADGMVKITVSYWRALDPESLPSYWYTHIENSVNFGTIKVTKLDRFRLIGYGDGMGGCCQRIAVHQISPRVLRFRAYGYPSSPDQTVIAATAKDSIKLHQPSGEPPP